MLASLVENVEHLHSDASSTAAQFEQQMRLGIKVAWP